jgi:hypothetical protein
LEKTHLRGGAGVFLASMFESRLIEGGEVIDASVGRGGDGESGSESTMTRARAYINRGGRTDCAIGGSVEEEGRRVPMKLAARVGLRSRNKETREGSGTEGGKRRRKKRQLPHRRTRAGFPVEGETSSVVLFLFFFCFVRSQATRKPLRETPEKKN